MYGHLSRRPTLLPPKRVALKDAHQWPNHNIHIICWDEPFFVDIQKTKKRQSSLSVWMARTRCHVSRFLIIPNSRNFKAVVLHPLSGRDKQSSNYQKNIVTKGKKSKLDTTISERWYKLLQRTTTSQGSAKYNCFFTHYIVTKWRADHFDNASLLMIT